MMITRKVRCKKCGIVFSLTYPENISEIGRDVISYCPKCRRRRTQWEGDE